MRGKVVAGVETLRERLYRAAAETKKVYVCKRKLTSSTKTIRLPKFNSLMQPSGFFASYE